MKLFLLKTAGCFLGLLVAIHSKGFSQEPFPLNSQSLLPVESLHKKSSAHQLYLTPLFSEVFYQNQYSKTTFGQFKFGFDLHSRFEDQIIARVAASGLVESESSSGFQSQPNRKNSGLFVDEATLTWNFGAQNKSQFSLGVIDQRQSMSHLIAGDRAFPGIRQFTAQSFRAWTFGIELQQLIPTNFKLYPLNSQSEALPTYFTAAVSMQKITAFGTQLRLIPGYFQFYQIPSSVAFESCLLGNSSPSEKCSQGSSRFSSEFSGIDILADTFLNLPRQWRISSGINFLKNLRAPQQSNQAISYHLNFEKKFSRDYAIQWGGEYFEKQSDVVPAFYSPSIYENNRKGFLAFFEFKFSNQQIQSRIDLAQTQPLNSKPDSLSTVNHIKLSIKFDYKIL